MNYNYFKDGDNEFSLNDVLCLGTKEFSRSIYNIINIYKKYYVNIF